MVTFLLYYDSEILGVSTFIKVEVNFVEDIIFGFKDNQLNSYIEGIDSEELKEVKFLYGGLWDEYTRDVVFRCYDPKEIFVEKVRASLTRIAYKVRDAVDIYYMEKELGYTLSDFRDEIIQKTKFTTDLYHRYEERIEFTPIPPADVLRSKELNLLLVEPPDDLQKEVERIHKELGAIRSEIVGD